MNTEEQLPDLSMDPASLYREEVFTDGRMGTIRRLTPVQGDGSDDSSREVTYNGSTQLLTPMGALPLTFEIPAGSLREAAERFGEEANKAMQQAVEELQELQRESASSIVTPDSAGMGGGPLGGHGAGRGGFQIP